MTDEGRSGAGDEGRRGAGDEGRRGAGDERRSSPHPGGPGGPAEPAGAVQPQPQVAGRALVLDAFAASRRSGKAGWDTMTTAVLKNRLLDLTDRAFTESDYGARDMAAFAKDMPDLLELLPRTGPGPRVVRLIDPASVDRAVSAPPGKTAVPPADDGRVRVRPDLWRAALDWHAAGRLVLQDGWVRPRQDGDPLDLPSFEPVTEAAFEQWKRDFVDACQVDVQGTQADALLAWASRPGPARSLGRELQDRWMETLRSRVLEHLRGWFEQNGLEPPADLVYARPEPADPAGGPGDGAPGALPSRRLKDFVLRCVHEMTEDELRALPIPAGVASRVKG